MKKIVGILGAAAVLATSVFAADVNAKVKVDGRLFGINSKGGQYYHGGADDGYLYALKIDHFSEPWNPDLAVSVSGDNAGATMSFVFNKDVDAGLFDLRSQGYSIWFKPVDMLKVTVGRYTTNLNEETIDYSKSLSSVDRQGYAVDLNAGGVFATLFFAPNWGNAWLVKEKGKDLTLNNELYFKAGYGADFGRVQAMFRLSDTKNMWFGAAYDNTFGSVRMFANALAGVNTDKGFAVIGEAFATTSVDIVGLSAFVTGGYTIDALPKGLPQYKLIDGEMGPEKAVLGATFKATFALNGFRPYIYLADSNLLADTFKMEIKPGVTGNIGIMSWEVAVDMWLLAGKNNSAFWLNVPAIFTVNF